MAHLVFGAGSSHTPLLNADEETWPFFIERDQGLSHFDKEGEPTTYQTLLRQADARVAGLVTVEAMARAHREAQAALDRLSAAIAVARLDALIVVGDDQEELFHADNMPAILIYWGETIRNAPVYHRGVLEWFQPAVDRYFEANGTRDYPVHKPLALHLVHELIERDFDVSSSRELRENQGEGHAFGFVHKRLVNGSPIPIVPICLNTYFPPNQPTPRRCYAIGQALRAAVESFPEDLRVGIIASGGLSHFTVDEELDRRIIRALREKDADTLRSLPVRKLKAGSSEIRNWVCVAGALEALDMKWAEYVPGYRSPAGTGTGICVAEWG